MNGFIPALVAVLLAELGPRAAMLRAAASGRLMVAVAALLVAAAVAGQAVAPQLTDWAAGLMAGVALALAGVGQWQRIVPRQGMVAVLAGFWGGGSLLIVFAFAARFGAIMTVSGALAGLAAAVAAADARAHLSAVARRPAGAALLVAGLVIAAVGLRLV